eukprot:1141722-Pelagomonas_calceolata.AAC.1
MGCGDKYVQDSNKFGTWQTQVSHAFHRDSALMWSDAKKYAKPRARMRIKRSGFNTSKSDHVVNS